MPGGMSAKTCGVDDSNAGQVGELLDLMADPLLQADGADRILSGVAARRSQSIDVDQSPIYSLSLTIQFD